MTHREPQIIDVTLRDGSNAIDFQFDKRTTEGILRGLDEAGVPMIDIGHGLGLGASERSGKRAKLSDAACQALARKNVKRASWGVFFQPKFGTIDDISSAAERGAQFIRIGTDVDKIKEGGQFVSHAKRVGLQVHACLMKAYAVDAQTYVERAREASDLGADLVVFMDSAGTMTPELTRRYMAEAVERVAVLHGFHAHNNLDLAIANLLVALEAGVSFIDTSLRGLGRSAGNGATEILALVLKKTRKECSIDWKTLQDTAECFVDPLPRKLGIDNLDMVFGFAGFHSSFGGLLERAIARSAATGTDKRDLIIELCQREKINVTETTVEAVLQQIISTKIALDAKSKNR